MYEYKHKHSTVLSYCQLTKLVTSDLRAPQRTKQVTSR